MKNPRKKITKLGWGVLWTSGKIEFFPSKKSAVYEMEYFGFINSVIFRCKIDEITK